MRVLGYIRVSSKVQAEEGVSLAAQESKIQTWGKLNDAESIQIFRENGVSGGQTNNRPSLKAALLTATRGDVLIVYSLSRLSRSLVDTVNISGELKRRGVDLVSITDRIDTTTASGKLYFHIMAAFNQHYRDTISDQTKAAMAYKRSKGERLGGNYPPYGQKFDGRMLVPVPSEQAVIRQIHKWKRDGYSLTGVARKLEARNIPRKAGGKHWHKTSVARIIARTAARGDKHESL